MCLISHSPGTFLLFFLNVLCTFSRHGYMACYTFVMRLCVANVALRFLRHWGANHRAGLKWVLTLGFRNPPALPVSSLRLHQFRCWIMSAFLKTKLKTVAGLVTGLCSEEDTAPFVLGRHLSGFAASAQINQSILLLLTTAGTTKYTAGALSQTHTHTMIMLL